MLEEGNANLSGPYVSALRNSKKVLSQFIIWANWWWVEEARGEKVDGVRGTQPFPNLHCSQNGWPNLAKWTCYLGPGEHCPDNLPRKCEISHLQPVPGCVLHEPVAAGPVVDEDHERDGDAAEGVQGSKPGLCSRWRWRGRLALRGFEHLGAKVRLD